MKLLFFLACICLSLTLRCFGDNVAICAIFQNDAKYIPEWIEFHVEQGVSHFFLYNNLSEDNYQEILAKYVKTGLVEIIQWPYPSSNWNEFPKMQNSAYMDGINRTIGKYTWCAFLDTDEFLFVVDKTPLPIYLKRYNTAPGIQVNWIMYGTSNVEKIPENAKLVDTLVWRAPIDSQLNTWFKSIVRPGWVVDCPNAHYFTYYRNTLPVDENGIPRPPSSDQPVSVNKLRINHYWTRDKDFFQNIKLPRRVRWFDEYERALRIANEMNTEYDPILANFHPKGSL